MGLWDFLIKKEKASTITCFTIGEDRTINFHKNESEGIYIVNPKNLLAYDSYPEAIGNHTLIHKGNKRNLGQICILYEPISSPFSFSTLDWIPKEMCRKKPIILANARAEAESIAVKRKGDEGKSARMETILLLVVGLFAAMILLYLFNSGIISSLFGR